MRVIFQSSISIYLGFLDLVSLQKFLLHIDLQKYIHLNLTLVPSAHYSDSIFMKQSIQDIYLKSQSMISENLSGWTKHNTETNHCIKDNTEAALSKLPEQSTIKSHIAYPGFIFLAINFYPNPYTSVVLSRPIHPTAYFTSALKYYLFGGKGLMMSLLQSAENFSFFFYSRSQLETTHIFVFT